jgi:hypothetical protein
VSYKLNPFTGQLDEVGSGGGGLVDSVNGQTGVVELVAEDIPFDSTAIAAASGGQLTGDDVQEIMDNFVIFLVPLIMGLFGTVSDLENKIGTAPNEPRDNQGVLRGLEDRSKYAVLGSGADSDFDIYGFSVANPGNLPDGGFDIYNEFVPLWQGYSNSDMNQRPYQEVFTIEEEDAWGGDLVETAISWSGRKPIPFAELTAADSATEDALGLGYGEYPSVAYLDNQYNGEIFMLQRVRYTYNPSTGTLIMYRPRKRTETADATAFGVEWKIAQTTAHQNPGSHPIDNVDPSVSLKIGKGSGRYLVSRVIVNGFDGTPYCDFDPVANYVDDNTVYDPVLDDNWVNTSSSYAKIVNSVDIANALTGQVTGSGTNGYEYQDYEKTGTYTYVGYEHADGRWYIYRRTLSTNAREYASGASSYSTNWTGRAGLSYA